MPIEFRNEKIKFLLKKKAKVKTWIVSVIRKEKKALDQIRYIFCDDKFLLGLNKKYLDHNTLTDIITFDYSDHKKLIGEIYISVPRVKENAKKFEVDFETELHRVIVHGVLHLCGYKDKKKKDKEEMQKMEEFYLKRFNL
jgi:probable rRNA maturation factor